MGSEMCIRDRIRIMDVNLRGQLTSKLYEVCRVHNEILEDTVVDYVQRLEESEIKELDTFLVEHFKH